MRYSEHVALCYINWRIEAKFENVKNAIWKEKIIELRQKGHPTISKTKRREFYDNGYHTDHRGAYRYLYWCDENDEYHIYSTNCVDDEKNKGIIQKTGRDSIKKVSKEFQDQWGITFKAAFGYVDEEYKKCIPKSFIYLRDDAKDKVLYALGSIDGCGQYPHSLCGLLPDAHSAKTFSGTVAPNPAYPFAFYKNSGHVAQYNKFDTHNWVKNRFFPYLFNSSRFTQIEPGEDETVLMKASKCNFDKLMKTYYKMRNIDESAKLAANSTIGYFHTNTYKEYRLAHIAAIAIARSNEAMLKMCNKIGFQNIVHVVVDGIIYQSSKAYGRNDKSFGLFHQEFLDCEGMIRGNNAYIIKDKDGNIIKIRHGAYNANEDGSPIKEDSIKDYSEMKGWKKIDYFKEE